jgi:hypothetical protein
VLPLKTLVIAVLFSAVPLKYVPRIVSLPLPDMLFEPTIPDTVLALPVTLPYTAQFSINPGVVMEELLNEPAMPAVPLLPEMLPYTADSRIVPPCSVPAMPAVLLLPEMLPYTADSRIVPPCSVPAMPPVLFLPVIFA